jgi:hypothetical protein
MLVAEYQVDLLAKSRTHQHSYSLSVYLMINEQIRF